MVRAPARPAAHRVITLHPLALSSGGLADVALTPLARHEPSTGDGAATKAPPEADGHRGHRGPVEGLVGQVVCGVDELARTREVEQITRVGWPRQDDHLDLRRHVPQLELE